MAITITLPEALAARLESEAQSAKCSVEKLAVALIHQSLQLIEEPVFTEQFAHAIKELVASNRSAPPPANCLTAPSSAPAEVPAASQAAEQRGEDFDLEEWNRNWAEIEDEMNAITRANDIAEGIMLREAMAKGSQDQEG